MVTPTVASLLFLWPVVKFARGYAAGTSIAIPVAIAQRSADAPLTLAAFCLVGWLVLTALVVARAAMGGPEIPTGHILHFVSRPALAGLIASTATFFASEHLCRTCVWPALLAATTIAGNRRLWRVRVAHRLIGLWLIVGALPLGAVALTTFTRLRSTVADVRRT